MVSVAPKGTGFLEQVFVLAPDALTRELVKILGRPLVAIAMGVKGTEIVARWERGEEKPHPNREQAMRFALQMAKILQRYSPRTVQTWFIGSNQHLGDHSPVEVLAEFTRNLDSDVQRRLLNAARAFANK